MTGRRGDAVEASAVKDETEGKIGAGRVILGGEAGAGEAGVFGEGGVSDVMVDFDRPVASVVGEQLPGGRAGGGDRGDPVGGFGRGVGGSVMPRVGAFAGDAEDLGDRRGGGVRTWIDRCWMRPWPLSTASRKQPVASRSQQMG